MTDFLPPLPAPVLEPPRYAPLLRPPRVWTVFVAFCALFVGMFLLGIFGFLAWFIVRGTVGSPEAIRESANQAKTSFGFHALFMLGIAGMGGGAAGLAAYLSPTPIMQRLSLKPSRAGVIASILLVSGVLALSQGLGLSLRLLHLRDTGTLKQLELTQAGLRGWKLAGMLAVIGVAAGVAEELFYRGYLQSRLIQRMGAFWGITITSLLFAFAHLDVAQSSVVLGLGLYQGWAAWSFGSIRPAILCHVLNNCVAVVGNAYRNTSNKPHNLHAGLIQIAVCAVVVVACMWLARRMKRFPRQAGG